MLLTLWLLSLRLLLRLLWLQAVALLLRLLLRGEVRNAAAVAR